MADDQPPKRRSFLQRVSGAVGLGGSSQNAASSSSSSSSSSSAAAAPASSGSGNKARSVSSPPAPSPSGGGGGAKSSNPFGGAGVAEGDEASGDDDGHSGEEDEDDDTYNEDELSSDMVARAAQDFTSMRQSVAASQRAMSLGGNPSTAAAGALSPSSGASSLAAVPASREELRVSACIISAEVQTPPKGPPFVLYMLSVTTGSTAGLSWKVGRRFREFEALHRTLIEAFGKDRFTLPRKALRRSLEPEYIRKKKTELAKYLSDLMLDPEVASSEALAHFLVSSLQDVVRGSVENLRVFAARGTQLKVLETQLQKVCVERTRLERLQADSERSEAEQRRKVEEMQAQIESLKIESAAKQADALAAAAAASAAAHKAAMDELSAQHSKALSSLEAEWDSKYTELATHTKQALKDKKNALRAVQDLDAQCRRLKAEKKILVKEVKDQRARVAAEGALGAEGASAAAGAGADGGATAAGSEAGSGTQTPAASGISRSMAASPLQSASSDPSGAGGASELSLAAALASPDPLLCSPSPSSALAQLVLSPASSIGSDGAGVEAAVEEMLRDSSAAGVPAGVAEGADDEPVQPEVQLSTPMM